MSYVLLFGISALSVAIIDTDSLSDQRSIAQTRTNCPRIDCVTKGRFRGGACVVGVA